MKHLPLSRQIAFSIGQLGWSLLSGLLTSYLVYFYQPTKEANLPFIVPQGLILGLFTAIGFITAFGRFFDAVTDPLIASLSDRSRHPQGRRIPFLKYSAFPLALSTCLVYLAPVNAESWLNAVWVFLTLMLFYVSITAYVTPFNALIPELGKTQKDRLNISTFISLTFILGTAISYVAPMIWESLVNGGWQKVAAMRATFAGLSILAFVFLLVPVFAIREKEYVEAEPVRTDVFTSVKKTFRNADFRVFVASDVAYWIAMALFQTGLPFYVKVLLRLPESMLTLLFVTMTAGSLLFYIPINLIARRIGKKKLVLLAFAMLSVTYLLTFFVGTEFPVLSLTAQGFMLVLIASLPLAILGILSQAVVADISQMDAMKTQENREGMFFAARTFAFKLGQMLSMLFFTTFLTLGSDYENDTGIRITALVACAFCLAGLVIFLFYNEKRVQECINSSRSGNIRTSGGGRT